MCVFASGARGTFEACRSMVGPESQNLFEIYGTQGSIRWNFEQMNELQVYIAGDAPAHRLHDRVRRRPLPAPRQLRARVGQRDRLRGPGLHRGPRVPHVGRRRRAHVPGFAEAVAYVSVQDAMLRSWESGKWEDVRSLREDA